MGKDENLLALERYFDLSRDAVCVVRGGVVVYANAACQLLFPQRAKGARIQQLLPEIDPSLEKESYVTAVTVENFVCTVTAVPHPAGQILTILRPEQSVPGVPPAAVSEMRSAAFNLRMALDRLLPRDTENEDPDVRTIYHSYFRLLHLIGELGDLENLSKGEVYCRMQTLDFAELLRELAGSVTFFMGGTGPALEVRLPEEPCYVRGDREKLQQLILILLCNSLRHTPAGGTVALTLKNAGKQLILSVDDNGEGMAGEELAWAFTPREAPPLSSVSGGGLGLFIAHGLARLHGGTIVLQSQPGKGTKIRLTLPVTDSHPLRDSAPYGSPQGPEQILTELSAVLPNEAYHPKYRG